MSGAGKLLPHRFRCAPICSRGRSAQQHGLGGVAGVGAMGGGDTMRGGGGGWWPRTREHISLNYQRAQNILNKEFTLHCEGISW